MEEMERTQKNFIEEIVEEDLRTGRVKEVHKVSARAERLSSYRSY